MKKKKTKRQSINNNYTADLEKRLPFEQNIIELWIPIIPIQLRVSAIDYNFKKYNMPTIT